MSSLEEGDVAVHDDKGQAIAFGADGITITGEFKVIGSVRRRRATMTKAA
ncbi:hypothetical protein [Caballeronia glathei]|nr:hypothetical protein [Caballeronia glathei]